MLHEISSEVIREISRNDINSEIKLKQLIYNKISYYLDQCMDGLQYLGFYYKIGNITFKSYNSDNLLDSNQMFDPSLYLTFENLNECFLFDINLNGEDAAKALYELNIINITEYENLKYILEFNPNTKFKIQTISSSSGNPRICGFKGLQLTCDGFPETCKLLSGNDINVHTYLSDLKYKVKHTDKYVKLCLQLLNIVTTYYMEYDTHIMKYVYLSTGNNISKLTTTIFEESKSILNSLGLLINIESIVHEKYLKDNDIKSTKDLNSITDSEIFIFAYNDELLKSMKWNTFLFELGYAYANSIKVIVLDLTEDKSILLPEILLLPKIKFISKSDYIDPEDINNSRFLNAIATEIKGEYSKW